MRGAGEDGQGIISGTVVIEVEGDRADGGCIEGLKERRHGVAHVANHQAGTLQSGTALDLKAGSSGTLQSGAALTVKAGSSGTLQAGASLDVKGGGTVSVSGPMIKLN